MLENVNFGFVVMRPTLAAQKGEKYLALQATANFAGLVGIDGFKLSASGITVEYNGIKSSGPNTTKVVDFVASGGFSIDTGNGEIDLDYDSKRLLVQIEEAELQIADYVFIHGGLAFQKVDDVFVDVVDGIGQTKMSATLVGGQDLTIFFGVNGPHDNPNAIGLAIDQADFALALLTPSAGGNTDAQKTRYIALRATSDYVGFVGMPGVFDLEASSVVVELNIATRSGAAQPLPVINFETSFPAETDPTDTDGDGKIDPAGLEVVTGAGSMYLDFAGRRIHASADEVKVNVAEFVYLTGNMAFDMGGRHAVTIRTGIPSNVGELASDVLDDVNILLGQLGNTIDGLKQQVADAIETAISTIQEQVGLQIDNIVATIFDQIGSSVNEAIGAVTEFAEGAARDGDRWNVGEPGRGDRCRAGAGDGPNSRASRRIRQAVARAGQGTDPRDDRRRNQGRDHEQHRRDRELRVDSDQRPARRRGGGHHGADSRARRSDHCQGRRQARGDDRQDPGPDHAGLHQAGKPRQPAHRRRFCDDRRGRSRRHGDRHQQRESVHRRTAGGWIRFPTRRSTSRTRSVCTSTT